MKKIGMRQGSMKCTAVPFKHIQTSLPLLVACFATLHFQILQSHHFRPATLPFALKISKTSAEVVLTPQICSTGFAMLIQSSPLISYKSSTARTSQGEYIGYARSWYRKGEGDSVVVWGV